MSLVGNGARNWAPLFFPGEASEEGSHDPNARGKAHRSAAHGGLRHGCRSSGVWSGILGAPDGVPAGRRHAPRQWLDILDERYQGKGTSSTFLLPRLIGGLGLAWGEDKALDFARGLRDRSDILLTRAPRESLLQSGERVYAFGEIDSLIRAVAAEGLPVSQVVPQPVVVGQFGVTIMKNAPHPNAGRLLAGFLASPEGKAARLAATSQADYGPTSDNPLAKELHSGKLQVVWDTPDNMAAREALFGRAAAILTGQAR